MCYVHIYIYIYHTDNYVDIFHDVIYLNLIPWKKPGAFPLVGRPLVTVPAASTCTVRGQLKPSQSFCVRRDDRSLASPKGTLGWQTIGKPWENDGKCFFCFFLMGFYGNVIGKWWENAGKIVVYGCLWDFYRGNPLPSGHSTVCYWTWPIEIASFPINSMVIWTIVML